MNALSILLFLMAGMVSAQVKSPNPSRIEAGKPKAKPLPAAIHEYEMHFEGYDLEIYSDAHDSLENHVLTGSIAELATGTGKLQDPRISKALGASLGSGRDRDVIITTDKNYKPLIIAPSSGNGIARYDPLLQKFIIACNTYTGEMANGKFITYYEPLLMVVNEKLEGQTYAIRSENSCTILDFVKQDQLIHVFTESYRKTETGNNNNHIGLFTVDLELSHADEKNPQRQVLEPVSHAKTTYNENVSLEMSALSKVGNAFYFLTSSISPTADLRYINRLYKFESLKLQEQTINNPQLASDNLTWYYTNGFSTLTAGFFFAFSKAVGSDVMLLKTDRNLNTTHSAKIATVGYTDDDRALLLPSGAVLLASGTTGKFWHYTVYDAQLKLVRTIESNIPENYSLKQLVAGKSGMVKAIYHDFTKSDKKSVIIQEIEVME